VADLLRGAGYATMCIGKWHLGDAPELLPTRQGFDRYVGLPFSNDMWRYHPLMPLGDDEDALMQATRRRAAYTGFAGQGKPYPRNGGFQNDLPLMEDDHVIESNPDQTQLTTRYTAAALDFIERQRDRPFFLYLAPSMPHVPLFVYLTTAPAELASTDRGLSNQKTLRWDEPRRWRMKDRVSTVAKQRSGDARSPVARPSNG